MFFFSSRHWYLNRGRPTYRTGPVAWSWWKGFERVENEVQSVDVMLNIVSVSAHFFLLCVVLCCGATSVRLQGYEVHGIIRRSSSFNTQRIDHIYRDRHESAVRLKLHYGDLTDSTNLMHIIYEVCYLTCSCSFLFLFTLSNCFFTLSSN